VRRGISATRVGPDYAVTIAGADLARLQTIFPGGVCDWSKPGAGQEPLRGTYLRLPLD
jgi:hypothetical protein